MLDPRVRVVDINRSATYYSGNREKRTGCRERDATSYVKNGRALLVRLFTVQGEYGISANHRDSL